MLEKEKIFINNFGNSDLITYDLYSKIEVPTFSKFFTNQIGIIYIGNMLKGIDIRLYLAYLKMLKENIKFIDNYNVEKSVCISEIFSGITRNVEIKVPNIRNGMDLLATSHELGHGLKSFTKINNERHLHSSTMYDETISILFGKICLERYINDFGNDNEAQAFEILNINNAINCLKKINPILPEYIKKQNALDNAKRKNSKRDYYKFQSFVREVEDLKMQLYTLISYPIGISLANVYDNFTETQKKEYLNFVSKYLLNTKHISYQMILDYFDIPFDAEVYINNFKEYIDKFETKSNNKVLRLGGNK